MSELVTDQEVLDGIKWHKFTDSSGLFSDANKFPRCTGATWDTYSTPNYSTTFFDGVWKSKNKYGSPGGNIYLYRKLKSGYRDLGPYIATGYQFYAMEARNAYYAYYDNYSGSYVIFYDENENREWANYEYIQSPYDIFENTGVFDAVDLKPNLYFKYEGSNMTRYNGAELLPEESIRITLSGWYYDESSGSWSTFEDDYSWLYPGDVVDFTYQDWRGDKYPVVFTGMHFYDIDEGIENFSFGYLKEEPDPPEWQDSNYNNRKSFFVNKDEVTGNPTDTIVKVDYEADSANDFFNSLMQEGSKASISVYTFDGERLPCEFVYGGQKTSADPIVRIYFLAPALSSEEHTYFTIYFNGQGDDSFISNAEDIWKGRERAQHYNATIIDNSKLAAI